MTKVGRPVETDLCEVLNAIRYLARSGGGWRMFAEGLSTSADRLLVVPQVRAALHVPDDPRRGADARPRACGAQAKPDGSGLDSQSIKAPQAKTRAIVPHETLHAAASSKGQYQSHPEYACLVRSDKSV